MGLDTPWRRFLAVTIQAPWLVPYESDLYWMVPAAALALLPAYFLASCIIEFKVMDVLLRKPAPRVLEHGTLQNRNKLVWRAVFAANVASYAMLAIVTLGWLGLSILRGGRAW